MPEKIKNDKNAVTPSDLHAIATLTWLSNREAEVLFGDAEGVNYNEYSALLDKLISKNDMENALRLRKKYDELVETHSDEIMKNRNFTLQKPGIANEYLSEIEKRSARDFPEAYARVQEMIDLAKKADAEAAERKKAQLHFINQIKALEVLELIRKKGSDPDMLRKKLAMSVDEWNSICNSVKDYVISDDEDVSETAAQYLFRIMKYGINIYPLWNLVTDTRSITFRVRDLLNERE